MLFTVYLTVSIIIVILTVSVVRKFFAKKAMLKLDTVTAGVITKVKKSNSGIKVVKDKDIYKLWAEYTVDGQTYATTVGVNANEGEYAEGQTIDIVYDENKPSKAVARLYGDNENANSIPMIICLIVAFCVLAVTMVTMPTTLHLSKEVTRIHSIVMHSVFALACLTYILVVPRTKAYKKDQEANPRSKKQIFGVPVILLIDNIWELFMDIFIQ